MTARATVARPCVSCSPAALSPAAPMSSPASAPSSLPAGSSRSPASPGSARHGCSPRSPAAAASGGEPGIGKTRLLAELADGARYGRCYEESLTPYQPFVEALGEVMPEAD